MEKTIEQQMKMTIQGRTLPALGFGTWQLKGDACREAVEDALALGYRHIDTAQAYDNEEQVGQAIKNAGVPRDQIFLVSKVATDKFAPQDTLHTTRESARKLQVNTIDLMLMHWPSDSVPHAETLGALAQLQQEGVIRHIGVSNFSPEQVKEATRHATIFCNQVKYHPLHHQDALAAQAQEMDYLLTAYSPLAEGEIIGQDALSEIGRAHNKSAAQVALRWLIQQQKVCAIPRSSSAEHRASNFDIFDFSLSDDEMRRIFALKE